MALKPDLHIQHRFDHQIWKLLISESHVAVELRNKTKREVFYVLMDIPEGKLTPIDFDAAEWWSGMESLCQLLSIKIYEKENARILSQVLFDMEGKQIQGKAENATASNTIEIDVPVSYAEGSDYFRQLSDYINRYDNTAEPKMTIEYYEHRDYIILSYYSGTHELTNKLIMTDKGGELKMSMVLDENLIGLGRDSFFIVNDRLIFVRDKKELMIYNI